MLIKKIKAIAAAIALIFLCFHFYFFVQFCCVSVAVECLLAIHGSDWDFASMVLALKHPFKVTEESLCTVPINPPIFVPLVPNFKYPLNEQFTIVSVHPL